MSDTITVRDPELAAMFETAAPTMGDIPRAINLGRTEDGEGRGKSVEHRKTGYPCPNRIFTSANKNFGIKIVTDGDEP